MELAQDGVGGCERSLKPGCFSGKALLGVEELGNGGLKEFVVWGEGEGGFDVGLEVGEAGEGVLGEVALAEGFHGGADGLGFHGEVIEEGDAAGGEQGRELTGVVGRGEPRWMEGDLLIDGAEASFAGFDGAAVHLDGGSVGIPCELQGLDGAELVLEAAGVVAVALICGGHERLEGSEAAGPQRCGEGEGEGGKGEHQEAGGEAHLPGGDGQASGEEEQQAVSFPGLPQGDPDAEREQERQGHGSGPVQGWG